MITIDARELKRVERLLPGFEHEAPTAIYRALNRAISAARTEASKATRDNYNLKATEIKNTMSFNKAFRTNLTAELVSQGPHVPLDHFKYKPRKPQPRRHPVLQVAVKKENGYKKIYGAFVADVNRNDVPLIFERTGKSRLPIMRIMAPAVPQMLDNTDVRSKVEDAAAATYRKRLAHNISRVLERYR